MFLKARSIQKITGLVAFSLLLSFVSPVMAISEIQAIKQLNQLVANKRYQEAYDLADKYVMDFGGEPRFDYLMGLAAFNLKEYEQAVFAFERAVIVKPKWLQARFQLAKAYFRSDNLAASKTELLKLKAESTNPDFTARIDTYIAQVNKVIMSKRRKFSQVLFITGGYDTNVNSGTTENSIFISQLGTDIPLGKNSREFSDKVINFGYQAVYQEPFSQKSLLIGTLGLFKVDYQDAVAFERTMADLSVKYQDELGQLTYQVGTFFRPMILDETHYRDQYGYFTNWTLPININWQAHFDVGFGKVDNRTNVLLDVRDVYATLSASYRTGHWQHVVAANHTDVRSVEPSTKHNSYHFYKLSYATNYTLGRRQMLTFDLEWQKYNYDVVHPVFGKVREEDYIRSGLTWRYMFNNFTQLQASYRYSNKDSNIAIYAYSRNEYIFGLTMQF